MKREIKFRAWIPDTGWLADGFSIAMDGTEWYDDNGHSWQLSQLELMQFIGLKDKNGKEIYEGDIISRLRHKEPGNLASPLVHKKELARTVIFSQGMFVGDDNYCPLKNDSNSDNVLPDFEIIGNVYENPDLLNDPK